MTRKQFEELTRKHGLIWIVPPGCRTETLVKQYAEARGYYWYAAEDLLAEASDHDRVWVYKADASDPRDVPPGVRFDPHYAEPKGITWHRVAETHAVHA